MGPAEASGLHHVAVTATAADHIESFHQALDLVARERRYLTMMEAFPLPDTRRFVLDMINHGDPHFVATVDDKVVGWCDISRHFFPAHQHRGSLAMGIIPAYRGRGLGKRLVLAALNQARISGLIRVELSVHADNTRAIALYEKTGFIREGVQRRSVLIDGRFIDTVNMALMLDEQ
ncbi:GNAT family protein [Agrobacterium sp. CNPSo 3708]|uniref:GNAT family N-acetyltransferase n=1 Tax=Agrobacterium sp. CNPSo 3708 TaxID=3028150 RepID=UPI002363F77F|nr:GNAT family protein [Agrobacterium sp. CNPSo 3708]MDD1498834.1 GNAT family protein [Agrobacterium sp. CNPSo 3708]